VVDGQVTVGDTILVAAAAADTNIFGAIIDSGHNIDNDFQNSLTNSTSRNGIDPMLAPLGNYGGLWPSVALLSGSPAIDGGDPTSFPATDQRGFPRPYGSRPDIGAFEFWPTGLAAGPFLNREFHTIFVGTNGQTFSIVVSSNLTQWVPYVTNTIGLGGYLDIPFPTTSSMRQFYRAVSR
jgi:hypothetical protein